MNPGLNLKQKRSRGNHIDVSSKSISQLVLTKVNLNFFSINYFCHVQTKRSSFVDLNRRKLLNF